tara:strand:- start:95 stop:304 length:210 start_codon:yes stop_codon:yes gene_type:complete
LFKYDQFASKENTFEESSNTLDVNLNQIIPTEGSKTKVGEMTEITERSRVLYVSDVKEPIDGISDYNTF